MTVVVLGPAAIAFTIVILSDAALDGGEDGGVEVLAPSEAEGIPERTVSRRLTKS